MSKVLLYFTLLFCILNIEYSSAQIVTTSGNAILVNNERYTIRGTCYSPTAVGATWQDYPDLGWPTYNSFAKDIELMNSACLNTIRTYYPIFDKARLDQLYAAGIRVIVGFPYQDRRGGVNAGDKYEILNSSYRNYINTYKSHPAILMWCFGNELNYTMNTTTWYTALEAAAQWVHVNDPNHPVTTANGELPTTDLMTNQCPSVDVWGANIYRNGVANTPIGEYYGRGGRKPFWYSEIGVDSYNHNKNGVDEASQATGLTNMWGDIQYSLDNNGICSGATFFNWTDEWWKNGSSTVQNANGNAPAGIFYPDGVTDEEYYGILKVDRTPKAAYYALQNVWKIACVVSNPATFVLEDFECKRHLGYTNYDGGFTIVNNPKSSTVNNSTKCVKYKRAPVQYAALIGRTPALDNAENFVDKTFYPTLDVYTSQAGAVVTMNFESSSDLGFPYPKGRYAVYSATTTKVNEWETLKFELQNSRDATVDPLKVNQIAILFNSESTSDTGTYYFDNLKGPTISKFTDLSITSIVAPTTNTACVSNQNSIRVTVKNNSAAPVNFTNTLVDVSAVVTGPKNQSFATRIGSTVADLASNASMEVLISNQLDLSLAGNYNINVNVHAPGDNVCANNTLAPLSLVSDMCVGLNDNLDNTAYQVFPNPTSGILNIMVDKDEISEIQLFNNLGDLIQSLEAVNSNEIQFGLENVNSGMYLLKIKTSNQTITKKIEVIH